MNAHQPPPVRLLTLTTLFPNAHQPRHGIFIANRLARLRDTGRIDAAVVAAVPWFPGAYRDAAGVPRTETICGMPVRHPRYMQVPAVGMRIQPDSLSRALLEELRRTGLGVNRFDVIEAHYFYPDGVAAARVAQALGLPLVISARGSDINLIGDIGFARQRMVRAANAAQALIAVSRVLADKMIALGMPADRVHVLRNGVDVEVFFPAARLEARQRLGLDDRAAWVLGVGNLVPEKGFDLLIRAVSKLSDTRLLIVGEGPHGTTLKALAARIAPGRVEFRNNMPQSQLRFAYGACDVLGLTSLREGWPNVVLEAVACGTPVVASPVGGVREILDDQAPALMVPGRDAEAWATALQRMLSEKPGPDAVSQYARRFGWDEVITAQCALYERVALANRSLPGWGSA